MAPSRTTRVLTTLAALAAALAPACSDTAPYADATPPPAFEGLAETEDLLVIPDRSAFAPSVVVVDDELIALVPSVIFYDRATYRFTSTDGASWSAPERVFGASDVFASYDPASSTLSLWHRVKVHAADPALPNSAIGLATSTDGLTWADQGLVLTGPFPDGPDGEPLATGNLNNPVVWHDGLRTHLYFTASSTRCVHDECGSVGSIGHAVSSDGRAFTFAGWIATPRDCSPTRLGHSSWTLRQTARAAHSGCAPTQLVLVAFGEPCDDRKGAYLLVSDDGERFGDPTPAPWPATPGTILTTPTGAWLFHGGYAEGSAVDLVSISLPGDPTACR